MHLFDSSYQTSTHRNQQHVRENLEENTYSTTVETDNVDDFVNVEPETMKCEEKVIEKVLLN